MDKPAGYNKRNGKIKPTSRIKMLKNRRYSKQGKRIISNSNKKRRITSARKIKSNRQLIEICDGVQDNFKQEKLKSFIQGIEDEINKEYTTISPIILYDAAEEERHILKEVQNCKEAEMSTKRRKKQNYRNPQNTIFLSDHELSNSDGNITIPKEANCVMKGKACNFKDYSNDELKIKLVEPKNAKFSEDEIQCVSSNLNLQKFDKSLSPEKNNSSFDESYKKTSLSLNEIKTKPLIQTSLLNYFRIADATKTDSNLIKCENDPDDHAIIKGKDNSPNKKTKKKSVSPRYKKVSEAQKSKNELALGVQRIKSPKVDNSHMDEKHNESINKFKVKCSNGNVKKENSTITEKSKIPLQKLVVKNLNTDIYNIEEDQMKVKKAPKKRKAEHNLENNIIKRCTPNQKIEVSNVENLSKSIDLNLDLKFESKNVSLPECHNTLETNKPYNFRRRTLSGNKSQNTKLQINLGERKSLPENILPENLTQRPVSPSTILTIKANVSEKLNSLFDNCLKQASVVEKRNREIAHINATKEHEMTWFLEDIINSVIKKTFEKSSHSGEEKNCSTFGQNLSGDIGVLLKCDNSINLDMDDNVDETVKEGTSQPSNMDLAESSIDLALDKIKIYPEFFEKTIQINLGKRISLDDYYASINKKRGTRTKRVLADKSQVKISYEDKSSDSESDSESDIDFLGEQENIISKNEIYRFIKKHDNKGNLLIKMELDDKNELNGLVRAPSNGRNVYSREYVVEKIVGVRISKNFELYHVKWEGFSKVYNTWEPFQHLNHSLEKLEQFLEIILDNVVLESVSEYLKIDPNPSKEILMKHFPIRAIHTFDEKLEVQKQLLHTYSNIFQEDNASSIRNFYSYKYIQEREIQQRFLVNWESLMNSTKGDNQDIKVENKVDLEYPPENFTYINEYVFSKDVIISNAPPIGCDCTECNYSFEKCCGRRDNERSVRAYSYTKKKKINLKQGFAIYECNKNCKCGPECRNRVVQLGGKIPLCIFRTSNGCGWGVKTLRRILRGEFVCQYVGEVITHDEAEKRGQIYDSAGLTYLFDLDFHSPDNVYTVDAANVGNVSHFINHSCDPNIGVWSIWIDCQDPNLPLLALFALRDIEKNEELSFDYMHNNAGSNPNTPMKSPPNTPMKSPKASLEVDYNDENKHKTMCKCLADKCRKYLF